MTSIIKTRIIRRSTSLADTVAVTERLGSQTFTATEGQTDFVVTTFIPTDNFMVLIDYSVQPPSILTRTGSTFTYAAGLAAGQKLLIIGLK